MQIYRINMNTEVPAGLLRFAGTLIDAKDLANTAVVNREAVRVELIEVPLDKANIIRLLDDSDRSREIPALRTWKLTDRGGLKEVPNGE